MYCSNCGNEIDDGAKFCTNCGTPVGGAPAAENAAETQPIAAAGEETQPIETQATAPMGEQPTQAQPPAPTGEQPTQAQPPAPTGEQPTQTQPPAGAPVYAQPAAAAPAAAGPWYGKTWVIVLFLIFFWPVGLVLMWMKTCNWQKVAKIIITVCFGIYVICWIVGMCFACSAASNYMESVPSGTPSATMQSSSSATKGSSAQSSATSSAQSSAPSKGASVLDYDDLPDIADIAGSTGAEVAEMLQDLGFEWNSSKSGYVFNEGGMVEYVFYALGKDDEPLGKSEFANSNYMYYTDKPMGYEIDITPSDFDDVVDYMMDNCDADASAVSPSEESAMFLTWPGGGDNIVSYFHRNLDTGTTYIYLYNSAYTSAGYVDEFLGGGITGMNASQFFDWFAQRMMSSANWQVAG